MNGRDSILKERMFGLGGPEGNHGVNVKQYLDNTRRLGSGVEPLDCPRATDPPMTHGRRSASGVVNHPLGAIWAGAG